VLRDSLGGNCHTVFLATLNPEAEFTDESVSTCRFASRCCQLTTEVVVNETRDLAAAVQQLERERDALRSAMKEIVASGLNCKDALDEAEQMERIAKEALSSENSKLSSP
jgi:kinesin family protein 6/9